MNLNGKQAVELARQIREQAGMMNEVRLAVCPPFVYLKSVAEAIAGSRIGLGAQNMYTEAEGAFTGEVSGLMLVDVGCRYVIVGHSERRHVLGESDQLVNRKVLKALALGLEPIVCLGEKLEQREAGQTEAVVSAQLKAALAGVSAQQMKAVTIAYEPVWAIGTGRNATPQQAEEVHGLLRGLLVQAYGKAAAERTAIQYGGSVKAENAGELMAMPNVDGALVGGASLKADAFLGIVRAARQAKN
jgi:triosephosphate isomerase